jgi:glucokinase-like ROK family protein
MKITNTADQNWVRRKNRAIILETLRTSRTLSRAGLAAVTRLNPSTVSSIISELMSDQLVRETEFVQPATGRPGRLVELNPLGGCSVGVEINVDFVMVILTDFTANILLRVRLALQPTDSQASILDRVERLIAQALVTGQSRGLRPLGIGVGLPGLVKFPNGELKLAPNLHWENVSLQELWTEKFTLPVYVDNEANVAALGEFYFGEAQGIENFVYLSAGIGLGGGALINGKLFRGANGYACEVGHMTIDPLGSRCSCGKRGCLETLAGPWAVVDRVKRTLLLGAQSRWSNLDDGQLTSLTFAMVFEAAQAGDPLAVTVLEDIGSALGIGVTNLVNIFNPERIVLGGAFSLASSILLPIVEREVKQNSLAPSAENVQITASALGADACVLGAVSLVLDEILRDPRFS